MTCMSALEFASTTAWELGSGEWLAFKSELGSATGICNWDLQLESATGICNWNLQLGSATGICNWDLQDLDVAVPYVWRP